MRRYAPVIVTTVLLVLAGCTGTFAGDEGLDASDSLDQMEYPDGYDETGINNTTKAIATHDDELVAAGGVVTVNGNTSESEFSGTIRIDADAERVYSNSSRNGESVGEMYYEDGTRYNLGSDGEDVSEDDQTYREAIESSDVDVSRLVNTFNWTAVNATAVHETPVIRYEITDVDQREVIIPAEDIDQVNGTLLVDENGRIHRFSYDLTVDQDGEQRRYRRTYEVDSYGDVTVERPDWVEEYREN